MIIDGYNLEEYVDIPFFELIEIASDEEDFDKRYTLFELANHTLKETFMEAVARNERDGWKG